MTEVTSNASGTQSRVAEGIFCIELGLLFFVAQDGLMKAMLGTHTVWTLIFARAVMSILILAPIVYFKGPPNRLITPLWPWHLTRAVLFTLGFTLFYSAFPFMGLAEVVAIFFAAPLITAIVAALWLKETIGPHRMAALMIGFVGVVVAMNPTSDTFQWVAIFPLICAATYAISQVMVRKIGDRETTLTIGLYTIAMSGALILPLGWGLNQIFEFGTEFQHLRWDWPGFDATTLLPLALLGTIGMIAYLLVSRAYQITSASLIAPFDYTYVPIAALMAYFLWDEVPNWSTLAGMALIVASGLYIGYREIRASNLHKEDPIVAESTFAPGNPMAPLSLGAESNEGQRDV